MNATPVPASGALPWFKEDIRDDTFLYQHKEVLPDTKSHTIKMRDLDLLRQHAIDEEREPVYIIEHKGRRWMMVEENIFNIAKAALDELI